MSSATLEQKNGVLELTKLEYHKKWYFPIYFSNSVSGPNISKINANGPFCPLISFRKFEWLNRTSEQIDAKTKITYMFLSYI